MPFSNDSRRQVISEMLANFQRSSSNAANRATESLHRGRDRRQAAAAQEAQLAEQRRQHDDAMEAAKKGRRSDFLASLIGTGASAAMTAATPFLQQRAQERKYKKHSPYSNFTARQIELEREASERLATFTDTLEKNAKAEGGYEWKYQEFLTGLQTEAAKELEELRRQTSLDLEELRNANALALAGVQNANALARFESTYKKLDAQLQLYNAVAALDDPQAMQALFGTGGETPEGEEPPLAIGVIAWDQFTEFMRTLGAGQDEATVKEKFPKYLSTMLAGQDAGDIAQVEALAPTVMDLYYDMVEEVPEADKPGAIEAIKEGLVKVYTIGSILFNMALIKPGGGPTQALSEFGERARAISAGGDGVSVSTTPVYGNLTANDWEMYMAPYYAAMEAWENPMSTLVSSENGASLEPAAQGQAENGATLLFPGDAGYDRMANTSTDLGVVETDTPEWADLPEEAAFHRIMLLMPNTSVPLSATSKKSDGTPASIQDQYNWMKNRTYERPIVQILLKWLKERADEQGVEY